MKTISSPNYMCYFCCAAILWCLCLANGFGQKLDTARLTKTPVIVNDSYKQALSRYIAGMTGVGCDTVLAKQLLQALREPVTSKNMVMIPSGTKSRIAVPAELQGGLSTTTNTTATNGWNQPNNYLNLPDSYQWYVSPNGSDNNPGTQQAPFRNIQTATDRASNGDAIKIADGHYTYFEIYGKDIYLIGNVACPQSVIIDGEGDMGTFIAGGSPELHGMTFMNCFPAVCFSNAYPFLSHLVMTQNSGPVVSASGANYIYTMCNSLLHDNNTGSNPLIAHNPTGNGFADICNVTIADNRGASALSVKGNTGYSDVYLMNSILYNPEINFEIAASYVGGSSANVSYSNIRGKNNLSHHTIYFGNGVIESYPRFNVEDINGRYRLMENSPCVDAGNPDFYDHSFPPGEGGMRSDMGAYGWESRMDGVCQAPVPGDNFESAIEVGSFYNNYQYEDTRPVSDYTSQYPWVPGVDVFYRFTITRIMDVVISHCGSSVSDSYIAVLNSSAGIIYSNDNSSGEDMCPSEKHARLVLKDLSPGTYWVLSKGTQDANGVIATSIQFFFRGDIMESPMDAGEHHAAFQYANSQNTSAGFTNYYGGRPTNDVYYRFTTSRTMNIAISHCGSTLADTYLYLLNADGNKIAENDNYTGAGQCSSTLHAYIKMNGLVAGTYYVVSKGTSQNGVIKTNITGTEPAISNDFGYPAGQTPNTGSSDNAPVGATAGAFNVSPTGAATYSIPVMVPPGLNGLQPSLAITYNSQGSNGIAGWGCNLAGISAITRAPLDIYHDNQARAMYFNYQDMFTLDGQRLISPGGYIQENSVYHPESDPYTDVVRKGTNDNPWFEVITKDGMIYRYGSASGKLRYNAPDFFSGQTVGKTYAWYLDYVEDPNGNFMEYNYSTVNYCIYLSSIWYGYNKNGNTGIYHAVSLDYETRPDVQPFRIENVAGNMNRRLTKITTKTESAILREYVLQYSNADQFSRLVSVTEKNGAGEALKPVTLAWNYLPTVSFTSGTLPITGSLTNFDKQYYTVADLNGDGISDIISLTPAYSAPDEGGSHYTLSQHFLSVKQANGTYQFEATGRKYLAPSMEIKKINHNQRLGGHTAFNALGDGKQYMLAPLYLNDGFGKRTIFFVYNHENNNNHNRVPSPTGQNYYVPMTASSELPIYTTGDIDNDGKDEIIYIEKGSSGGYYPGKIGKVASIASNQVVTFDDWVNLSLNLTRAPEAIFIADFNGDGMNDLAVFTERSYRIYWNKNTSGARFSEANVAVGNFFNTFNMEFHMLRMGDFNGDGLPDFVVNETNKSEWYFALNNGNGTFTKKTAYTSYLYNYGQTQKDNDKFDCQVLDLDQDGKSDIIITKALYTRLDLTDPHFHSTETHWLRSTGTELIPIKQCISDRESDAESRFFIAGDFTGDGQVKLVNFGYNCYDGIAGQAWRMYRNPNYNTNCGMLASITDGMGNATTLEYAPMTSGIYTRDSETADKVVNIIPPLAAVKKVTTPNGIGGDVITTYRYHGAKVHREGKGFMGMTRVTAENNLGVKTATGVSQWNNTWFAPAKTYSQTTMGGSKDSTEVTLTYVDKGSKKHFVYAGNHKHTDMHSNETVTTTTYDNYGNLTKERTEYGGTGMYREVLYSSYVTIGQSWFFDKPRTVTVTQKHTNDNAVTAQTTYAYNSSNGLMVRRTDHAHTTDRKLTRNYTHDIWGNVLTEAVDTSGQVVVTNRFEYDPSRRFVAKAWTTPTSEAYSYGYDTWGNLTRETDETNPAAKLTTTHTYDGWGRRTATILHDGRKQKFSTGWGNSRQLKYYTLVQADGAPWTKTWYDATGRPTQTESRGPKGMLLETGKTYNAKGQLATATNKRGSINTTTTYTYDGYGRISREAHSSGQNIDYTYGNRWVKTVSGEGWHQKTSDAWGGIVEAQDPLNTVTYEYHSNGKPKKITAAGGVFEMAYDAVGNQTKLVDPNAGTTNYRYDDLGRVVWQKDGNGKISATKYDALGRVEYSTLGGVRTDYEYMASGNGIYQVKKITTGSNSVAYGYDKFGRPVTETRTIEGENPVTFGYAYDTHDRLQNATYPGSVAVSRAYDAFGNLEKVEQGNTVVWQLTGMTGAATTATLGGTMTTTASYNTHGLLTGLKTVKGTAIVRNFTYGFNGATGNLTTRTGMIAQKETFYYDNLDRLKTINHGTPEALAMSIGYSVNGNISSKTGLGTYSYNLSKVHALENVANTGNLISQNDQTITYTAFNKASQINETVGADAYQLDIKYGPDQQRWKTVLKKNNSVTKTTIFAGDYEKITDNGVTRELYYISGGDGLAAVYVKTGSSYNMYYVHADHLGSVVKLTTATDTTAVFRATYDAWGRQTITKNTFKFHRGYTGHEHLPEFGLINMNGRMYDPMVGRFLSPDPFVQIPDFSQSYNRYAYCINNPLIYTDENGYWFGWDDLFVAVVGFAFNYVSYGISTGNWGGKAFAAGGVGAVTSWLGYNLFIRPDIVNNVNNMPNPAHASFKHYMNVFKSDATQQYLWQTGLSTLSSSLTNNQKLSEADKNSWGAVWTVGAYGLAGSLTQGADIDPSKVKMSKRLRQWGGIVLSDNISGNMNDDGIFEFNRFHIGILGYNIKDKSFYSVFSKGLDGNQRFDMAFETVLGATMINKNIHYHGLETSRCNNKGIFGLRKSPVSKFMIPFSKIGQYSSQFYQMSESVMLLYNGKSLFQYWYDNHYENGMPKF